MGHRPLTLSELAAFIPRLQATVDLLIGSMSSPAKRATRTSAPRLARHPIPSGNELQARLISILKRSPKSGLAVGELVTRLSLEPGAAKYQLKRLKHLKKVRVQGRTQSARWFAA